MTNAKFYRNFVCAGLGALALSYVPLSHAFYAQATPPVGFVAGAINTFNGAKAGATASLELGRIAANASLNVGGRAVNIATKIPLAVNAARVVAAAIYLHPGVRVAVHVAAWLGLAGFVYNAAQGWVTKDPKAEPSDGYTYCAGTWDDTWACAFRSPSLQTTVNLALDACKKAGYVCRWDGSADRYEVNYGQGFTSRNIEKKSSNCPVGWFSTPAGCVQQVPMVPVTQEQFVEDLTRHPMGPNILPELPFDLPVEVPYIEPIFVPTGNPVKNPNYDPSKPQTGENQPYVQPGVKIDPANDAKNPFQVNVQPSNRPTANPNGSTDAQPITPGSGTETDGSNDQPKEDKDERDLCEKNPDILACQKVDTEVPDDKIPKAERSISFQAENVFGGGSCPANQYARVGPQQYMVADWTTRCDYITSYVKPIAYVITFIIVCGIVARALE